MVESKGKLRILGPEDTFMDSTSVHEHLLCTIPVKLNEDISNNMKLVDYQHLLSAKFEIINCP